MGKMKDSYKIVVETLKGKYDMEDQSENVRNISNGNVKRQAVRKWTEFIWLRIRSSGWLL
jgi:hypothetical protein